MVSEVLLLGDLGKYPIARVGIRHAPPTPAIMFYFRDQHQVAKLKIFCIAGVSCAIRLVLTQRESTVFNCKPAPQPLCLPTDGDVTPKPSSLVLG